MLDFKKKTFTVLLGFTAFTAFVGLTQADLPDPGVQLTKGNTAIVITDPQNDFLSPKGVTWGLVGKSVTDNHTVENIERLFKIADKKGIPVFVSPHYYYPLDHQWEHGGALEKAMHSMGMFDRKGALTTEGFAGSGADWGGLPGRGADDARLRAEHPVRYWTLRRRVDRPRSDRAG